MKMCSKCKQDKELDQFNKHLKSKDKLSSWCKICVRERSTKYYNQNHKNILIKHRIKNREKNNFLLSLKLDKNCKKCGYNKCTAALDFHHLDRSNKIHGISYFNRNRGLNDVKEIMEEIEKCIILCSNCHREFHYLEKHNHINIKHFLKM